MNTLPDDWLALLGVVYALGLKHGMDPDHLATIDGIARSNAARNPRLARADRRTLVASRAMGLAIAGLSLLVGSYGLARLYFPAIAGRTAQQQLLLGCAAVAIIGLSFIIGLRLARAPVPVRPRSRAVDQFED